MFWTAQSTIEETFRAYNNFTPQDRSQENVDAAAAIDAEVKLTHKVVLEKREGKEPANPILLGRGSGSKKAQSKTSAGSAVGRRRVSHSFTVGTTAGGAVGGVEKQQMLKR